MTRSLALVVAIFAGAACNREPSAAAPETTTTSAAADPASAAPAAASDCALVRGRALIDSLVLESADGACRVYLPSGVDAGALDVRISAAGEGGAAAVERDTDDGTLFANAGTVTLTTAADGHFVGTFEAEDNAAPSTGSIAGTIDVTMAP